jgi:hypothetical protein
VIVRYIMCHEAIYEYSYILILMKEGMLAKNGKIQFSLELHTRDILFSNLP